VAARDIAIGAPLVARVSELHDDAVHRRREARVAQKFHDREEQDP
jgi:hypothetical protein